MKPDDLAFVAALARAKAGLMLRPERAFFVESRLATLARREGEPTVEGLAARLRAAPEEPLAWSAVEALATPEDQLLPRPGRLRPPARRRSCPTWPPAGRRARCGCGAPAAPPARSPISLAIMAEEYAAAVPQAAARDPGHRPVGPGLEKAWSGLYTQFEVKRGLPIRLLLRHFDKVGDNWQASARLRQSVRWGRLNLMNDFTKLGRFDIILCRNVLSYFDAAPRHQVLKRLAGILAEDGCLMLGAGEAAALPEAFEPARGGAGLHRRNPAFGKAAA